MNGRNDENLKELFERFHNAEEADKAVEDVQKAEQIFREHSAPVPDSMLIADIKAKVTETVSHRRTSNFKWAVYKTAGVAAVFIILAVISVKLFEKGDGEPEKLITASIASDMIWESDNIASDDVDLATLFAEVEQIERDLLAVQLGENNGNGNRKLVELELELIEINSDFWKG